MADDYLVYEIHAARIMLSLITTSISLGQIFTDFDDDIANMKRVPQVN